MAIAARTTNGSSTNTGSGTTDIVVDKPSGVANGDLLVVGIYHDPATVSTVPSGWAEATSVYNTVSGKEFWIRVYWKRASGEGTDWTWVVSTNVWWATVCQAYTGGLASGDALDGTATSYQAGSTVNCVLPALTTTVDGSMLVAVAGNYDGRTWSSGTSPCSNERADANGLTLYDGNKSPAGSSGAITVAAASTCSALAGVLLALKPAAADTGSTAALSGAGTLTAGQPKSVSPAASALSGTGTLASAQPKSISQVAASLSGTGSLSATADEIEIQATAALSGAGSLSAAQPTVSSPAIASLSGTGSLAAAEPTNTSAATASLSGVGSLSATEPANTIPASAVLSGTGSLSATPVGTQTLDAIASLSGTGSLSASEPISLVPAVAALSGAGTLVAIEPTNIIPAIAALSGAGTLSATPGAAPLDASASLSGTGSLSASQPISIVPAVSSLSGVGSLSAGQPLSIIPASAALSGTGTLEAVPCQTYQASAALSASGTLSATATPSAADTTERVYAGSWVNPAEYLRDQRVTPLPAVVVLIPGPVAKAGWPELILSARSRRVFELLGGVSQPLGAGVLQLPELYSRAVQPTLRRTNGSALAADVRAARRELEQLREEMAALRARVEEEEMLSFLLGAK